MNKKHKVIGLLLALIVFLTPASVQASTVENYSTDRNIIFLPILMYHQIKPYKTGKNTISPYEMESDLKFLKENNYQTITMADLIDFVYKGKPLPENPIILSFDDGYLNNYIYVYPLLKKYDMKVVLSIIGKDTDDFTKIPSSNLDYSHLTWDQIIEMKDSGLVEIQNHTYGLHTYSRNRIGCQKKFGESQIHYEKVIMDDIGKMQQKIICYTGVEPNTFTYPYGQVSRDSYSVIKKMGFKASLTCKYGINIISKDPEKLYGLRRICRSHKVSAKKALEDVDKTLKYRKIM